jgi:hypothetical protein
MINFEISLREKRKSLKRGMRMMRTEITNL